MSTAVKIMGFFPKFVWVMGYYRFMGYGYEIPANQLGGSKILWVFAGYGLSQVWVMTGLTVFYFKNFCSITSSWLYLFAAYLVCGFSTRLNF